MFSPSGTAMHPFFSRKITKVVPPLGNSLKDTLLQGYTGCLVHEVCALPLCCNGSPWRWDLVTLNKNLVFEFALLFFDLLVILQQMQKSDAAVRAA